MVDTPSRDPEAPGQAADAAPQAAEAADQTRESRRALAAEVLESNSRETRELIQGLAALRTFVNGNEYSGDEKFKKIALQAITDTMVVLGDIKTAEDPSNLSLQSLESALRQLDDVKQNFVEIVEHKRQGLKGKPVVETIKVAFDEKHRALDALRANAATGLVESAPAPAVDPEAAQATAPAEAPEVPLTPEQIQFNVARAPDLAQSVRFKEFLVKIHTDFSKKLDELKTAAPRKAGDAVDEGLGKFAAEIVTIQSKLDEIDQLAKQGKGNDAKAKLDELKTYVERKLDETIQKLTEDKNKTTIGIDHLNDDEKAIMDAAIQILTQAKGELPALAEARTASLAEVEAKHNVLVAAGQEIPQFVPSAGIAQQQQTVDQQLATIKSEAPPTGPEVADTMEQFTDKLQDAWEKMGEAMQEKKWGAVLAGLIGMLGLVLSQLKSLDSLDDWTSFVGSFGEEEAETPAGTPEKPADISQVLAQFGIEAEVEQGQFAALTTADVIRFVTNDGAAPAAGEAPYPQPLVDFKANQADAYGKLKAQLELNGFEAYHESLSDEDKSKKTLGDFITYRFNSDETKEEGWKT